MPYPLLNITKHFYVTMFYAALLLYVDQYAKREKANP